MRCNQCGADASVIHACTQTVSIPSFAVPTTGWTCPVCKSGVAPHVEVCPCSEVAKVETGHMIRNTVVLNGLCHLCGIEFDRHGNHVCSPRRGPVVPMDIDLE